MKRRYFSLIVLIVVAAACGTVATPEAEEVALVETEGHDVPTATPVPPSATSVPPTATIVPPTETAVPPTATQIVPTETPLPPTVPPEPTMDHSAMPTAQPQGALPGDPANGQVLFNELQPEAGFACSTCHRVDSEVKLIGPGLLNMSGHTAHFPAGQKAEDYIRASITDPGAFVVPDYPDLLMPRIYTEIFTEQEINDLVAYLLTL